MRNTFLLSLYLIFLIIYFITKPSSSPIQNFISFSVMWAGMRFWYVPTHKLFVWSGPGSKVLIALVAYAVLERTIDPCYSFSSPCRSFWWVFVLVKKYQIKTFAKESLDSKAQSYQDLINLLRENIFRFKTCIRGFFRQKTESAWILWPTKEYLAVTSPKIMWERQRSLECGDSCDV